MNRLDPEKLTVEFRDGVTTTDPVVPRRYTLTHSDITAELFLTIGLNYALDKISEMRDEVLGEWVINGESFLYYVYLHVDGQLGPEVTAIRDYVFRMELPLALEAIRYGDSELFDDRPELDRSPIVVFFLSEDQRYNRVEEWGTFADYRLVEVTEANAPHGNKYLLDVKYGDVTGDGIPDKVSLLGTKENPEEVFVSDIRIVIEDGATRDTSMIKPEFNMGYSPSLFLGNFTKDGINDIKLSIDAGGSGGYGYHYIYTLMDGKPHMIFDFNTYNQDYEFKVDYNDQYRVSIGNVMMDKLFILDVSYQGYDYLTQFYDDSGKLKEPVQGEVLALSVMPPIVNDENCNYYYLLAFQRIIGTTNSDTLGYIENLLSWDGEKFASKRMMAAIPGTNLIEPI